MEGTAAEQRQMERKHIFVINRNPAFLDIARELLQGERFNVTTTNYVPRTFDQIAGLQPDLLIVDLAVGQQAGWDLLERLHAEARTRGLPVLVTATDQRLLEQAADAGAQSFLVEPFVETAAMLRTIDDLIGRA